MRRIPSPASMEAYYERRADEYDDWYLGIGRFSERDRPGFGDEVRRIASVLSSLAPAVTLDVGCGTGFITRSLPGRVVAADRSLAMLRVARGRLTAPALCADALRLPFRDASFTRVFAGHVYGHLAPDRAAAFLDEAGRLAPELLILDSSLRPDVEREEVQERVLNDGSAHRVYKRYFDPMELLAELGGSGEVLVPGRWFVLVRASGRSA
jgi:SAM-dependent methyltransferase